MSGSGTWLPSGWDFPCCYGSPHARMLSSLPRWTCSVLSSLASCTVSAFPMSELGRHPHRMVSGLAQCSVALRPACSLTRLYRAFYTKGFECFIASALASAASGWSDSCRVGYFSPTRVPRLFTAHSDRLLKPLHFPTLTVSASHEWIRLFDIEGELARVPLQGGVGKTGGHAP